MPTQGTIFALDLGGDVTGYCFGSPGTSPTSGSVRLRRAGEPRRVSLANLTAFLSTEFARMLPEVVVPTAMVAVEAPLALQAFKTLNMGEAVVRMTYGLHGIVEAQCHRYRVPLVPVPDSTARKHFIGKGRMGDRASTKAAVLARCHLLGYVPKDSHDLDRADACAVWDWACATYGRQPPSKLFMFGEGLSP